MKKIVYYFVLIFIVSLFIYCSLLLIKPGASIFYRDADFNIADLQCAGNSCELPVLNNSRTINSETFLFFEDNRKMNFGEIGYVETGNIGSYAVKKVNENFVLFSLSPYDMEGAQNRTFQLRILKRTDILNKQTTIFVVVITLFLLFVFIIWILNSEDRKKRIRHKPIELFPLYEAFFENGMIRFKQFLHQRKGQFFRSISLTIISCFVYILMEWLFFVTKPSLMDALSFYEKGQIFFVCSLYLSILGIISVLIITILDFVFTQLFSGFLRNLYVLPSAILLSCTVLLLIDNFTYTFFGIGIVTANSVEKVVYMLIFIILIGAINKKLSKGNKIPNVGYQPILQISVVLCSIALIVFIVGKSKGNVQSSQSDLTLSELSKTPNIILISSDGMNADHLSAYSYERETTPFLKELSGSSLFAENNFPNAAHTTGSITSVLTGKMPLSTKVIYPPNTLRGVDQFEHLPGLLRRNGYKTVSFVDKYYINPQVLQFKMAFDMINGHSENSGLMTSLFFGKEFEDEEYFLESIWERIFSRIKKIFFIEQMDNPYSLVTDAKTYILSDDERLDGLYDELAFAKDNGQPLFAQIHLLGTHGGYFYPAVQKFSENQEQKNEWMDDFYDDAILSFDNQIKDLVDYLVSIDEYDNTVLVIYSDHGQKWQVETKIPLIVHFPNDENTMVISENTQNLDIAPTIIDYLGMEIPAWMDGQSLLHGSDADRMIFAFRGDQVGSESLRPDDKSNAFFPFASVSIIQNNNWYTRNLLDLSFSNGLINSSLENENNKLLLSESEIDEQIIGLFVNNGYELQKLEQQLEK